MKFRARRYGEEEAAASLLRIPTESHPLQLDHPSKPSIRRSVEFSTPSLLQNEEGSASEVAFDDPLRSSGGQMDDDGIFPAKGKISKRSSKNWLEEQFEKASEDWECYRSSIAQRFASAGTITVSSAFDVITRDHKARGVPVTTTHLQQLDEPEEKFYEDVKILTQQEYITRLKELNAEISEAWANNERFSALRLSIKVAKLLSYTYVPQFYPTLFVLVTDVMENVGDLVWNRIKEKAGIDDFPVDFSLINIPQEAKDTCANWFLKIGSIRELLPRVYLEIAILRCIQFLQEDVLPTFQRISMMIRGIADPLASAYAYIFLCRRGLALIPFERGYLINSIHDFSTLLHRVISSEFDKKLYEERIQKQAYLGLMEPMFEWTLRCIFKHAKQEDIQDIVVALCGKREKHDVKPLSMLVNYMLKELPAVFVGNHAMEMSRLVKNSSDISLSQHANYVLLGGKFCECPPPRELRLQVLNDVWKEITRYTSLAEYTSVANAFMDYILQSCSETEVVIVLRDLKKHLISGELDVKVLSLVENILIKLLDHYSDLYSVLNLEGFVDIIDMLYGDARLNVYKSILSSVSRNNSLVKDPVSRNFLFEVSKTLHDSLDSLSTDNDRRQITRLVVRYVQLVDFGHDLEHHLDFLTECRATFWSMDYIREEVVHISNRIAVQALKHKKGFHTVRSLDFVKACTTFNEITIPSITSITLRVKLFLEASEVALMNGLISHTLSLLKSGILCLQEMNAEDSRLFSEDELLPVLLKLCSFLIVVPGDPELGVLYFLRGLVNLLDSKPWFLKSRKRMQMLFGVLFTVATFSQEELPYNVDNDQVDSNDILYYGDSSYQEEISVFAELVLERIFAIIEQEKDSVQRGYLQGDAQNALVITCEVLDGQTGHRTMQLLQRAK